MAEVSKTYCVGSVWGYGTVIGHKPIKRKNGKTMTLVVLSCKCGSEYVAEGYALKSGRQVSCGCYAASCKSNFRHGLEQHPLYSVWKGIKKRCSNIKEKYYFNYGGRGIVVCDEWVDNPKAFIDWGMANGYKKGLSIDRIDNNGNYEPSNCRFITKAENNRNRRNLNYITIDGETRCLAEWAKIFNVSYNTLRDRHRRGKPLDDFFNRPVNDYTTAISS